jgi:hypothetical protein
MNRIARLPLPRRTVLTALLESSVAFGLLAATAPLAACGDVARAPGPDATDGTVTVTDVEAPSTDVSLQDAAVEDASVDVSEQDASEPELPDVLAPGLPDIARPPEPVGGVCGAGTDCLTGYCNTRPSGGYCTLRCANTACPEGSTCSMARDSDGLTRRLCLRACEGDDGCRLDQFCPSEAGLCLPRCQPEDCRSGYVCDVASGRCQPEGPCVPTDEVCDGVEDEDCDGRVDEDCGPPVAPAAHVRHVDLGRIRVGGGGLSRTLEFVPSADARSFVIVARHVTDPATLLMVQGLTAPGGQQLIDYANPTRGPIPTYPSPSALSVLVPNRDTLALASGRYRFSLAAWQPGFSGPAPVGEAWVSVLENRRGSTATQRLDLNLWFVGTTGLSAATAPDHPRFAKVMARFVRILEGAGVALGEVRYFDVTGPDADRYRIVDTSDGWELDEHDALIALSGTLPADNKGVSLFFVEGFTGIGLLGKAGGIPGPPLVHGTSTSGVVVSLADYLSGRNLVAAERSTADTMAHELGHQLGLFHTSEMDGRAFDPISDTGECAADGFDQNGDGLMAPSECVGRGGDNLMFWTSAWDVRVSEGQRLVVSHNPAIGE